MQTSPSKTIRNRSIDPVRHARVRHLVDAGLDSAARWLAVGAAGAMGVLLIDRALGLELPLATYPALLSIALGVAVIQRLATRPSRLEIARRIDRRLGLKDRMSTAEVLAMPAPAPRRYDPAFAAIVQREARRLAGALDIRTVAPIRLSRWWGPALVLTAAVLAGARFLPGSFGMTLPGDDEDGPAETALVGEQPREKIRETIDRARKDLREAANELPDDKPSREVAAVLDRLAEQLNAPDALEGDLRPIRDQSAAELDALADELTEQAQRDRAAAERLAERFAGIEPPETPMSAAEFEDALRRGDFGTAAERLAEQLERRRSMSENERAALAEHLRRRSEQLEQSREAGDPELEERAARLEQALRDQGLDDRTIRDLMDRAPETDPESARNPEQTLREQNVDPEVARQLTRELEQLDEQRDVNEQVQRDLEGVEQSLRDAAEELHPQPEPAAPPREEPPSDQSPSQDESGRGESSQPESAQREPEPSPDADQSQPQEQQQQGGDPAAEPSSGESPASEPDGQPSGQPQKQQRQEQSQQEDGNEPHAEPAARPAPSESPAPPPREGDQPPGSDEDQPGESAAPSGADGPQPQMTPGAASDSPSDPSRALREIAERRRQADRRDEASRSMRDRAREMLEQMTPEERRQLFEQLERQFGDAPPSSAPGGGPDPGTVTGNPPRAPDSSSRLEPGETEEIDMRRAGDDPGEVVAEWLSDQGGAFDPDAARRSIPRERLESARRVAERAVNESAVPLRYHGPIRRYFRRLPETGDTPMPEADAPASSNGALPASSDDTGS